MFPLEFPLAVLESSRPGEWVLDPFCGRGTTLFAARLRGLSSVGIDANGIAAALAAAKLVVVQPETVVRRCRELLASGVKPDEVPEGDFWDRAFAPSILLQLCSLREQLRSASDSPSNVALRAILLGVLHGPRRKSAPSYCSNQMPRTYATKPAAALKFWTAQRLLPPQVDVLDVVRRRARYVLEAPPAGVPGNVLHGGAAAEVPTLRQRFSWVITSPPYYGMRTYLPDQWLRAWFLGGPPSVEYRLDGQLSQRSEKVFVEDLGAIWKAVAGRCHVGARLVIRFGALPSRAKDPTELITRSLSGTESRWTIDRIESAGSPRRGARQADHMVDPGAYAEEVDVYATLAD